MSDITVEIIEPANNIIEIDNTLSNTDNVSVEVSNSHTVEVINAEKLLINDFPDFYHTKIIDFNTAVSGLLPTGTANISVQDVQNIIGLSGIIAGTGIKVVYNSGTGFTSINTSGLTLGSQTYILGNTYQEIKGLSLISGISLNSPTVLISCYIDGGTP